MRMILPVWISLPKTAWQSSLCPTQDETPGFAGAAGPAGRDRKDLTGKAEDRIVRLAGARQVE